MASGSEVQLIVEAGKKLASEGVSVRLVSFPSWELFQSQNEDYQQSVLPRKFAARGGGSGCRVGLGALGW